MKKSHSKIIHVPVIEHWEEREDGVFRIWKFMDGATYEVKTPYDKIPIVQMKPRRHGLNVKSIDHIKSLPPGQLIQWMMPIDKCQHRTYKQYGHTIFETCASCTGERKNIPTSSQLDAIIVDEHAPESE